MIVPMSSFLRLGGPWGRVPPLSVPVTHSVGPPFTRSSLINIPETFHPWPRVLSEGTSLPRAVRCWVGLSLVGTQCPVRPIGESKK